jgi:hypothetical protein
MITGHVPAVRLPHDHADGLLAAAIPAYGDLDADDHVIFMTAGTAGLADSIPGLTTATARTVTRRRAKTGISRSAPRSEAGPGAPRTRIPAQAAASPASAF